MCDKDAPPTALELLAQQLIDLWLHSDPNWNITTDAEYWVKVLQLIAAAKTEEKAEIEKQLGCDIQTAAKELEWIDPFGEEEPDPAWEEYKKTHQDPDECFMMGANGEVHRIRQQPRYPNPDPVADILQDFVDESQRVWDAVQPEESLDEDK